VQLHEAKARIEPRKKRKRIGRGTGSGHGKTAGRGHKGAKSRSGWSSRNMVGGQIPLWRRLPMYGFSNAPFKKRYTLVNIGQLSRFTPSTHVTPELLKEEGLIKQVEKDGVKVLGNGDLEHALVVRANAFSKGAQEKIEAAGGRIEVIPEPRKPVRRKMRAKATLMSDRLQ